MKNFYCFFVNRFFVADTISADSAK